MASSARQAGPARTTSSGLIWLKRVKNPVELHATAERVISRTPCACRSVALPSLIVFHDNDGLVTTLSVPSSVYRTTIGRHLRRPKSGWLTLAGPSGCPTAKCIFVASAVRQSVLQSMTSIDCAPRSKSSSSHVLTAP